MGKFYKMHDIDRKKPLFEKAKELDKHAADYRPKTRHDDALKEHNGAHLVWLAARETEQVRIDSEGAVSRKKAIQAADQQKAAKIEDWRRQLHAFLPEREARRAVQFASIELGRFAAAHSPYEADNLAWAKLAATDARGNVALVLERGDSGAFRKVLETHRSTAQLQVEAISTALAEKDRRMTQVEACLKRRRDR